MRHALKQCSASSFQRSRVDYFGLRKRWVELACQGMYGPLMGCAWTETGSVGFGIIVNAAPLVACTVRIKPSSVARNVTLLGLRTAVAATGRTAFKERAPPFCSATCRLHPTAGISPSNTTRRCRAAVLSYHTRVPGQGTSQG